MYFIHGLAEWSSHLYNGKVRLTGYASSSEGFLEVYTGNASWHRICGAFGLKEGNAACRQLGYTGIAASAYASFKRYVCSYIT